MAKEVCRVFIGPMCLSETDIEKDSLFKFSFLQRTGAGSKTLCVPAVAESFKWDGKNVSSLAKAGQIIKFYIRANSTLLGLPVSYHK